mgnify:CR=1 FL=1
MLCLGRKMLPGATVDNILNSRQAYTMPSGHRLPVGTECSLLSDSQSLCSCKSGAPVGDASQGIYGPRIAGAKPTHSPSFEQGVPSVVPARTKEKMVRSHAGGVIATVTDQDPTWDRPEMQDVRESVGFYSPGRVLDYAVALDPLALPNPAPVALQHPLPKEGLQRWATGCLSCKGRTAMTTVYPPWFLKVPNVRLHRACFAKQTKRSSHTPILTG